MHPRRFELAIGVLVIAGVVFFGGVHLYFQAACFIAALALLTVYVAAGALRGGLVLPRGAVAIALAAFVAWGSLQAEAGLSLAPGRTREALLRYGAAALVFALASALARGDAAVRRLSLSLVLLCGFEALYGLGQLHGGRELILFWPNPHPQGGGAATGTYVNRNHFAGLLALATPIVLGRALVERPALAPALPRLRTRLALALGDPGFWRRLPLLSTGALGALATGLSLSRGGILALALGLLAFAGLALRARAAEAAPTRPRSRVLATFAVLVLGGFGLVRVGARPIFERFQDLPADIEERPASRAALARGALAMIADRPLAGTGLGGFELAYPRYQRGHASGIRVDHAHSDLLEVAAEAGLPATAVVCVAIAALARRAFRRARGRPDAPLVCGLLGALVAVAVRALLDFDLHLGGTLGLVAFVLGLLAGPVAVQGGEVPLRRGLALALAGAMVALWLAAAPYAVRVLRADLLVHPTIRPADDRRDAAARSDALDRAIALRPDEARYRLEGVKWRHADFANSVARAAFDAARSLTRSDAGTDPPAPLVRILAAAVRSSRAAEEAALLERSLVDLRAARANEPGNPRVLVALALLTRDREEARRASDAAVRADPLGSRTLVGAALARLRFERDDPDAQGWLARGLAFEPELAGSMAEAAVDVGADDVVVPPRR